MRVAFVSRETTHRVDSEGNRRIERLARQLTGRGHDVTIFCTKFWSGTSFHAERDGVTYRGLTEEPSPTFGAKLPWKLWRFGPDVVHGTPTPASGVVGASIGASMARAPLLVEWYGDADPVGTRFAARSLRAPDRLVTSSEMVRTDLRERGVDDDRLVHIPEGIDIDLLRSTEPDAAVDIAFGHRLDETSNLEGLFLALAELRDREWTATIVGDGPAREEYEAQAADLRIDDRIEFVGECDRAERLAIYRGAHVFAQTAYQEYFATELLWALAAGCVGIVEYQAESSAHELIENYDRSFRVTDPESLADAIVDAGDLEPMDFVPEFERYDHDAVLEEYLQCYRDLRRERGVL